MADPIQIAVFDNAFAAVCEQMGETLRRCAVSVNVKDRLDFSAALFDPAGQLVAQAAHIPVHLGSMAYALRGILDQVDPGPGEMVLTNDPYRGGTHLPDLTVVAPVDCGGVRIGYVASRAHHADVGGKAGVSMALATTLADEGVVIPPVIISRNGELLEEALTALLMATSQPDERRRDLAAQVAANGIGIRELLALHDAVGKEKLAAMMQALLDYSERGLRDLIGELPEGRWSFTDYMDGDGIKPERIKIAVALTREGSDLKIDFAGTAPCVEGNVNAVLPVTMASVFYVFRCLLGDDIPANAGCLKPLKVVAEAGTVVNASWPHAVAAGNVETSQRIVDVLLGALAKAWPDRIPAASCGSMNNVSLATRNLSYYETVAGGMGASREVEGLSCVQTHMTNTRNTSIEALESTFPVRLLAYRQRTGSGGAGAQRGGDGVIREMEVLESMTLALLTERRQQGAWGLAGGRRGRAGKNRLRTGGRWETLPAKVVKELAPGDRISIETPGGGGYGKPSRGGIKDERS
jgi:N-methylhydantoinase B